MTSRLIRSAALHYERAMRQCEDCLFQASSLVGESLQASEKATTAELQSNKPRNQDPRSPTIRWQLQFTKTDAASQFPRSN
ncbi:hypothetical protein NDU88_004304 [Pleurodeles waltl]|uniref:Uncharacterized protein n=1 Tax=Pleurodeles waltl TaxID=8319 RepID=A0AAV7KXG4_PLEWA|nr:hypothetical protein NDU88_004304 [Pleurodeles waltl]